jgi:hypothetical protein
MVCPTALIEGKKDPAKAVSEITAREDLILATKNPGSYVARPLVTRVK